MAEPRERGVDPPLAQDASPGKASRRLPSPVGTPGSSVDARMHAGMLTADPSTPRPPAAKTAAEKQGGRYAQDDNNGTEATHHGNTQLFYRITVKTQAWPNARGVALPLAQDEVLGTSA